MEKILQKEKVRIYCARCKMVVDDVWVCKLDSIIGIRYAVLCSNCQRLIGIFSSSDVYKIEPNSYI